MVNDVVDDGYGDLIILKEVTPVAEILDRGND